MLRHKFKLFINIATIVALGALAYFSWPQIVAGWAEIEAAKLSVVLLMIPLQVLNFYAIGQLYKSYFEASGHYLSSKTMLKVALELNFVNHVFPSGGVAGFSYMGVRMRRYGIAVSRTTLAQAMRFALTFLSFLFLLFFGMFLLSFGRGSGLTGIVLFVGLSVAFLTLFGVVVGIYIVSSEARIRGLTIFLPKIANRLLGDILHKRNVINVAKVEKLFSDLHKDYVLLSKDWKKLYKPFLWSMVVNATEVLTIYLAYIALGELINPGAVILSYAVASIAGLISVFPGGIGIYEALMTGVLASAGVPKALALSGTLIYRIFTIIVFIPLGFLLYQFALRRGDVEAPIRGKRTNTVSN